MDLKIIIGMLEAGELRQAWHALGELLHDHKDDGGTVTAQDDSGGHGGTNPPPPHV